MLLLEPIYETVAARVLEAGTDAVGRAGERFEALIKFAMPGLGLLFLFRTNSPHVNLVLDRPTHFMGFQKDTMGVQTFDPLTPPSCA